MTLREVRRSGTPFRSRAVRRSGVLYAASILLLLIWTCAPASANAQWRLQGGGSILDELGNRGGIALIIDPAEVFLCGSSVPIWLEWGRAEENRLLLVFSREPTASERYRLATVGIRRFMLLAPRQPGIGELPVVLLVDGDRFTTVSGHARSADLAAKSRTKTLSQVLARMQP